MKEQHANWYPTMELTHCYEERKKEQKLRDKNVSTEEDKQNYKMLNAMDVSESR